ncbi:MAG: hypothetical protein A2X49_03480 [Lentisphaerae bacterium GWF2_52_8]|nr:MAG: hypothetical protein A2X49_03480 [Lentisphaerae bacterium GWF2_52_8]
MPFKVFEIKFEISWLVRVHKIGDLWLCKVFLNWHILPSAVFLSFWIQTPMFLSRISFMEGIAVEVLQTNLDSRPFNFDSSSYRVPPGVRSS